MFISLMLFGLITLHSDIHQGSSAVLLLQVNRREELLDLVHGHLFDTLIFGCCWFLVCDHRD